jgi:hypothetical protein
MKCVNFYRVLTIICETSSKVGLSASEHYNRFLRAVTGMVQVIYTPQQWPNKMCESLSWFSDSLWNFVETGISYEHTGSNQVLGAVTGFVM